MLRHPPHGAGSLIASKPKHWGNSRLCSTAHDIQGRSNISCEAFDCCVSIPHPRATSYHVVLYLSNSLVATNISSLLPLLTRATEKLRYSLPDDDISRYLVGVWKRTLELREFGPGFQHVRTR